MSARKRRADAAQPATFRGGHPDEVPLTDEERRAIAALRRLARQWPKSLWLFSAAGTLHVMRRNDEGDHATNPPRGIFSVEGMVRDYSVASVSIPNDGGDW